ncbi:MAG TPA: serine hydrolase [Candidatus Angelobacter sp.]|nr:serine hydrolase [Candidatus Angelobacter sp.]
MAVILAGPLAAQYQARFGLTPSQFQTTFNDLFKQGYRLKTMSGYVSGGSERYGALWTKTGGPAWQARFGLSGTDFQKTFDDLTKQGYRLTWISAHEVNGDQRFEGIWEQASGPPGETKYGMTSAQYQVAFDDYKKQGFRLIHVYGYSVGGSATYAAIWEKSPGPAYEAKGGLNAADFQKAFNDYAKQGYVLKMVSGFHANGEDEYAAIWEKTTSAYGMTRWGVPDKLYQGVYDNYYYQGYTPQFLTAFSSDGNSARVNTIWTNTNYSAADLNYIQDEVAEALKAAKIAGLSIAVAKDGRLVYAAGFGLADKENNIAMSVDHRLRIGSISKTVTSVAIYRMIEAKTKFGNGKTLALDSKVFGPDGVLGNKIAIPPLLAPLKNATIQDLLEHVSGIPDTPDPVHCSAGDLDNRIAYQLALVLPRSADPKKQIAAIPRAPGAAFEYSNLNFIILQSVIETLTGKSYQNYILEHLFAPSGITTPRLFTIGPYDPNSGEAKHYLANGSYAEYAPGATCDNMPPGTGAGGWAMTAKDLLHHLAAVDGVEPGEILAKADQTTMTTGSTANPNYGKGWQLNSWGSCTSGWSLTQGHNGGLSGAFSDLFRLPNGLSFVLISNQEATPAGFCSPVATPGKPKPAQVACGGKNQPVCADEPLARMIEILGKVKWPDYDLF